MPNTIKTCPPVIWNWILEAADESIRHTRTGSTILHQKSIICKALEKFYLLIAEVLYMCHESTLLHLKYEGEV